MAKIANIILLLFAVLLIAGCGSDSQSSAINQEREAYEIEEAEAEEATYESEEETEEVGGPLEEVGTITTSPEKGTELTNHYSLGPLLYASEGTPPEEALGACGIETQAEIERSVFARGEVTITYSQGTLPVGYILQPSQDTASVNEEGLGLMPIFVGGEWYCRTPFKLEFQSGESKTYPLWVVVSQVLTNSRPRVPASAFNNWYLDPVTYSAYGGHDVISGPGAGWCEEEWEGKVRRLFMYNRSGWCE